MQRETSSITFGKWRRRIWPFHLAEMPKLLPLILIKFFISINYGILTCMKDTMNVTSKGSGAEVIPVLKGWIVLPAAMLMVVIYSKLSNMLSKKTLFYTVLGGFLAVIFLYGFVLYPHAEFFSPGASADWLLDKFGSKYSHWIAIYRHWIHALLFITAELWGSVVILVMFWGFANDITSVNEAKRSYNIYIAAGDLAALSIGPIVCYLTKKLSIFSFTHTVQGLLGLVLLLGLFIMGIYWWVNRYILTNQKYFTHPRAASTSKKKKEKLSLREGFKYIAKSRYLLGIAIIMVGYGLVISLIEVTWKKGVQIAYPSSAEYQMFMSKITSGVGLVAFITSIFFGSNIIRKFGWHCSAQITPILVGATGIAFFFFVLFQDQLGAFTGLLGLSPLMFIVFFGGFQNIASKAAKYSFFDPTKEMAYIPLDEEAKVKGKAAVDVVGSRLGKSGAAWIQVGLMDLFGTGSIFSITHLLVPVVVVATLSWIYSVSSLNKKFAKKHADQEQSLKTPAHQS